MKPQTPEEFLEYIRGQVIGRSVSVERLAANSLLIYVDCEPGDRTGTLFWFEPSWHFRGPDRVLTGSRHAQEDDLAPDPMATFYASAKALEAMRGLPIEGIEVEAVTNSLVLNLGGGFQVRGFVSDPTDDLDWHINHWRLYLSLEGCAQGLELVERDDWKEE